MSPSPGTIPILFYGAMRKRFGKVRHLAVKSPAEAVRALMATVPGFRAYLQENQKNDFHVLVGETSLGEGQLHSPVGRTECIKFIPAVAGAKDEMFQIVAGAVLIAVGTYVGVYSPGAGQFIQGIGLSMMMGGVAQMLAGTPRGAFDPSGANNDLETFSFGSPTLTVGQGGRVPLGYGRARIGGHVISAGVDVQTWQDKGFGGLAPDNAGTRGGDGDTSPWVWAIAP